MLKTTNYYLLLLIIISSFITFSCAPTVVTEGTTSSDSTTVDVDNLHLITHDKDCVVTDSVSVVKHNNGIFGGSSSADYLTAYFYILGDKARSTYYAIGYKAEAGSPTPSFNVEHRSGVATQEGSSTYMIRGKLTLPSSVSAGQSYSYKIVLRDVQKCYDEKGSDYNKCTIPSNPVKGTDSDYDSIRTITINVEKDEAARLATYQLLRSVVGAVGSNSDNAGIQAIAKLGSAIIKSAGTNGETPVDPSAVENACLNGWPIK